MVFQGCSPAMGLRRDQSKLQVDWLFKPELVRVACTRTLSEQIAGQTEKYVFIFHRCWYF